MTLYESLQDKGKGRFIDNGCDFEMIALAKGTYTFTVRTYYAPYEREIKITLDGKQGENARRMEKEFFEKTQHGYFANSITKLEYSRKH